MLLIFPFLYTYKYLTGSYKLTTDIEEQFTTLSSTNYRELCNGCESITNTIFGITYSKYNYSYETSTKQYNFLPAKLIAYLLLENAIYKMNYSHNYH